MKGEAYARALYELAEDAASECLAELELIRELLRQNPEFLDLLSDAGLGKRRWEAFQSCFQDALQPVVLQFLHAVIENGEIRNFAQMVTAFARLERQKRGVLDITAWTAAPLTDEQREALTAKLERVTGKSIALDARVEPALLGGVRLRYADKLVDGTLRGRLERLSRAMAKKGEES